eukprot:scaffold1880_cov211-Pinguiococcus_pyrenoidosus.AAC.4
MCNVCLLRSEERRKDVLLCFHATVSCSRRQGSGHSYIGSGCSLTASLTVFALFYLSLGTYRTSDLLTGARSAHWGPICSLGPDLLTGARSAHWGPICSLGPDLLTGARSAH